MILPVGVVIGTIIFMFMYFYNERRDEQERTVIGSHEIRVDDLDDMVGKFTDWIGSRDVDTEQGRNGLKSAASMIEGRLGPQNLGLKVEKGPGEAKYGLLWKSLWVDVRGQSSPDKVVIAAVSFSGVGEVADANVVSTMVMLAASMARDENSKTVRFVFLPLKRNPTEQNKWLLENCIQKGEVCDGIIGVGLMETDPEVGGEVWQVVTGSGGNQEWWKFLRQEATRPEGDGHSVWITHSVFSSKAWKKRKNERLESTLPVASQLASWLRRAAE